MQTEVIDARAPDGRRSAVLSATNLLRAGEIVALPTETVYGLAADALNADAVAKIFEAKERPRFDPLIVHLPDVDWLTRVAVVEEGSRALVNELTTRFWPGPFTIVLPRTQLVADVVTAGLETVAVRMSAHAVFAEIVNAFGSPVAAPSANRFGKISPTTAEHVLEELGGRIPLIVDAGQTAHGIESTVITIRGDNIVLLRPGPITVSDLTAYGEVSLARGDRIEAPGQLETHYCPRTKLLLVDDVASFAVDQEMRCGLLAWSNDIDTAKFAEVRQLSARADLRQAATNLFRYMRELDASGVELILAEAVPDEGIGSAILDRLRRASAGAANSRGPDKPE